MAGAPKARKKITPASASPGIPTIGRRRMTSGSDGESGIVLRQHGDGEARCLGEGPQRERQRDRRDGVQRAAGSGGSRGSRGSLQGRGRRSRRRRVGGQDGVSQYERQRGDEPERGE